MIAINFIRFEKSFQKFEEITLSPKLQFYSTSSAISATEVKSCWSQECKVYKHRIKSRSRKQLILTEYLGPALKVAPYFIVDHH